MHISQAIRFSLITIESWFATREARDEGRAYTEIHFYKLPETGEHVLTYWDVSDDTQY